MSPLVVTTYRFRTAAVTYVTEQISVYTNTTSTGLLHFENNGPLKEYRPPGESKSGSVGKPLLDELRESKLRVSSVPSELWDIIEFTDISFSNRRMADLGKVWCPETAHTPASSIWVLKMCHIYGCLSVSYIWVLSVCHTCESCQCVIYVRVVNVSSIWVLPV